MAVLWADDRGKTEIRRIIISTPLSDAVDALKMLFPFAIAGSCSEVGGMIDRIDSFFIGEAVEFPLDEVCLDLCPPFHKRVLLDVYSIPRGKVSFYGAVAKRLNSPGTARAVGTAMADNAFPIVIPCHRVIRSDGFLGGYGGGPEMKRKLLEMEGVEFRDEEHVAERCFY
jgi:methylated-DNA-[protein]-cysteine S-methyltransferase